MFIQIIIIAFLLFAASRVLLRFKDRSISIGELIFWMLLWIGAGVITLLPQSTDFLAKILGVGRGVDAIIYIAIIILFYGMFRLYVKMEHIEHEITDIVRKTALKNDTKTDDKEN